MTIKAVLLFSDKSRYDVCMETNTITLRDISNAIRKAKNTHKVLKSFSVGTFNMSEGYELEINYWKTEAILQWNSARQSGTAFSANRPESIAKGKAFIDAATTALKNAGFTVTTINNTSIKVSN